MHCDFLDVPQLKCLIWDYSKTNKFWKNHWMQNDLDEVIPLQHLQLLSAKSQLLMLNDDVANKRLASLKWRFPAYGKLITTTRLQLEQTETKHSYRRAFFSFPYAPLLAQQRHQLLTLFLRWHFGHENHNAIANVWLSGSVHNWWMICFRCHPETMMAPMNEALQLWITFWVACILWLACTSALKYIQFAMRNCNIYLCVVCRMYI